MKRARYTGVSRASFDGGRRRLTYGDVGFVNDSDERGLRFIQPESGEIWVVDRYEIQYLSSKSTLDTTGVLLWIAAAVLVVVWAAVQIAGWLS